MFHMQGATNDWPRAVARLPVGCCFKAVDRADLFKEAKVVRPGIYTILRHWDDTLQHYDGNTDWDVLLDRARHWFNTHVDGTFRDQHAPFTDAVSWHNEIWANSQNEAEVAERGMATEAAVRIWNTEFRPTFDHDIQLVIGEAAVGNWMPRRIAELSIQSDNVIGYHPYAAFGWNNKPGVRWGENEFDEETWDTLDWYNLSGLWDTMEYDWGLKPVWAFTEAGPFESAMTGWRASACLGADRDAYIGAVRDWLRDVQLTSAYQEGRILGFSLFTTGGGDQWSDFETRQPEMDSLASMISTEWSPAEYVPPPPEPEPPPESEVPYKVIVNLLHQEATKPQKLYVVDQVHESRETILQSADDAARLVAPGQSGSVVKSWGSEYWENNIEVWLKARGVKIVEHWHYPDVLEIWHYPLPQRSELTITDRFTFPHEPYDRDYNGDGYYDHRHEGIDLAAILNEPVAAMRDGKVIWSSNKRRSNPDEDSKYGEHIVIEHEGGYTSWYAHLNNRIIFEGAVVVGGQIIGMAGTTGFSDGVHLHLSIQHYGYGYRYTQGYVLDWVIDPQPILEEVLNRE